MKQLFLSTLAAIALLLLPQTGRADDTNAVDAGIRAIVANIKAKIQDGKKTEADFADDFKAFDALYAQHKNEKNDDTAAILVMKYRLYMEVLDDPEKGAECIQQIKRDLPDTKVGQEADQILAQLKVAIASEKIRKSLEVGMPFPDFDVKDLAGKPLSVANYKGKVVLVDFWATWCGPCKMELPNVIATYNKYHAKGFEIIGVSLDVERAALESYIKDSKMPWPEYFDGLQWKNKLAVKYGVESIPTNYLLDGNGKILGSGLRGEELEQAVAKALAK